MARNEAYRKAEDKIKKAWQSGAKELDLSVEWSASDKESSKLTELP